MNEFEKFKQLSEEKEQVEEKIVQIMGMEIETDTRKHERIPSLEKPELQKFIEDDYAKNLERIILESVVTDDPLLLEGDPAVGKNITIEYLAALLNRPLYRVSLNGQTDIGNLIGKWVPKNKGLEQQLYDKIRNRSSLSDESKKILSKYLKPSKKECDNSADQPKNEECIIDEVFAKEDIMQVAENESIEISSEDWLWQDSEIVQSIEEGAWLVLDEVNTAEPQILVRLNALLEKGGEMILSENSNRKVKRNSKFRIFGTMNPPGGRIKGRVQLSEDYVSRWRFVSVKEMGEADYLNRILMSEGLVDFEQSEIEFGEFNDKEKFKGLTDIYEDEWVKGFWTKYTVFYHQIKKMVGKDINIASDKEQNITYDERDRCRFKEFILAFHDSGNFSQTIQRALNLFCDKLKSQADREKVIRLAEDIIRLDEPTKKESIKEIKVENEDELVIYANLLNDDNVPEDHKEFLRQKMGNS